ncbi:MAG: HD domain-containing protein, partial [Smithellaceae bacterium]
VVMVISDGHPFEVATFRSDDVYEDGRRPTRVHYASAKEDVLRRDFTVNGLLMDPVTNDIIDYVGGRDDIQRKILRTIGDPVLRFNEDHLRMLRAIRFAANLEFSLDEATKKAVTDNASQIAIVSAERTQEELGKILTRGGARRGLELLAETGLLRVILPEVDKMIGVEQPPRFHPEGDVWQHSLIMLDLLSGETAPQTNPTLAWGALLHDVGKPLTRTEDEKGVHFYGHVKLGEEIADDLMRRLRFSRERRETVVNLIRQHMVFMNVQNMRQGRLKRFLRMPDFDLHLQLHRLDCLASHGNLDNYTFCLDHLRKLEPEDLRPPRLLTGDDLVAMGYVPGKIIGEILHALEEEQLERGLRSREDALRYVYERWTP